MSAVIVDSEPVLAAALDAADIGLAVIWQRGKCAIASGWNKGPALSADELRQTFRPGLNVAFRAGPTSRIDGDAVIVLDVDIRSDDETDKAEARAVYAELVGTLKPTVRTGGGGVHLYLRVPDDRLPQQPATVLRQSTRRLPSDVPGKPGKPAWTIELLAAEHACTMPPSIHPSGKPYRWESGGLANVQRAPESLLQALALVKSGSTESQSSGIRSAPEPLRRPLPPAEPYPLDALGDVLGGAAKAIQRVVQAPAGLCGQSILSAASLAAQAHADVVTHGAPEPLALWHVTVGVSSERKSGADKWALQAHREVERADADASRQGMAAYEIALSAHKAAARAAEKGKDADAIRANLERLGQPPEPPLSPLLLLPEATLEGLHKLYQGGRPTVGLFNDDAGDFLDGHAMNRDNRTKSAAGFSKLWDSGEFSRIRAGDGASKFYGRRLAMHVMVQPVIAERVLSDDVLCGQGFLPRCLVAWPQSTIGMRPYVDVNLSRDPALARYWSRMRDLLTAPLPLRHGTRNELEPRALVMSPDARARWIEIANAIESDMQGEFAGIQAWAGKAASQVARIAGVLTLVEEPGAGVIRTEAVERAATLALYHLREAARVVGTASVPAKVRHAEALLSWCRVASRTLLYSSDALRNGPNCIRTSETFTAAVEVLEAAGWAEFVEGGAVLDGRQRARVWQVRIGETD